LSCFVALAIGLAYVGRFAAFEQSDRARADGPIDLSTVDRPDALERGLEDVHAWLPPEIAKKFGKRLGRLGWIRDDEWTPYCKKLI